MTRDSIEQLLLQFITTDVPIIQAVQRVAFSAFTNTTGSYGSMKDKVSGGASIGGETGRAVNEHFA